jgi:hypothetical protein
MTKKEWPDIAHAPQDLFAVRQKQYLLYALQAIIALLERLIRPYLVPQKHTAHLAHLQ